MIDVDTIRMNIEEIVRDDLACYLRSLGEIGEKMPETEDISEKWEPISKAYIPDGIREFSEYPTVSLGWMMYTGMAIAAFWEEDWENWHDRDDIYQELRAARGFDCMDEYIRQEILGLDRKEYEELELLVAECASRTDSILRHANIEPGSKEAFQAYVACLHQLYMAGAGIQLSRMGYQMTKVN